MDFIYVLISAVCFAMSLFLPGFFIKKKLVQYPERSSYDTSPEWKKKTLAIAGAVFTTGVALLALMKDGNQSICHCTGQLQ